MEFCHRVIPTRLQYVDVIEHKCHRPKGHSRKCEEFLFLGHLKSINKQIVEKTKRDTTMTTGVVWKSADTGSNRTFRWVTLSDDEELFKYGINMAGLKSGVIAKLCEKAADHDSCILMAAKLTWPAYQMENAPEALMATKGYLEDIFGTMVPNTTRCVIRRLLLDYELFPMAARGKAAIETCHKNPRMHSPENVGSGHRECDAAQGTKTLDEFYQWIEAISARVEEGKSL